MSAYHARAGRLDCCLSALGTCRIRLAAAVILALIAYIKVVAVKKLVVEPWAWLASLPYCVYWSSWAFPLREPYALY
jgi:hypothetical protein